MTNPRRFLVAVIFFALVIPILIAHLFLYFSISRHIQLPAYQEAEVIFSDQNWSDDERQWFYHETQGGAFEMVVPFAWFVALEQPRLPLFVLGDVPLLTETNYISRFGFLPNSRRAFDPENVDIEWALAHDKSFVDDDSVNNPYSLPVGFARDTEYRWPTDAEEPLDVVGFTCAACHTAQVNYNGKSVRIDGGPALTNLTKFELAVGASVFLTTYLPTRFDRFANTVLGEGHSDEDRADLKLKLKDFLSLAAVAKKYGKENYTQTVDGFGRLDALGRIENFVFAEEVDSQNWRVGNAPVNYPPIWDTPWFDWVQYNGSIKQPMIRNAGEAMGVFARVNVTDVLDSTKLFSSTVRVDNLHEIESLIRGEAPGDGLRSPRWPDVLGPIDTALANRGADLYKTHCSSCHHGAPVNGSPFDSPEAKWTEEDSITGLRYLDLALVNIYEVGTDPLTATNFAQRTVNLGSLGEIFRDSLGSGGGGLTTGSVALPFLVSQTIEKAYSDLGLDDSTKFVWAGMRPNEVRAPLAYKARPLNGVWATAPYLHNGSVPTLFQMVSPASERDKVFYLGNREFDPEEVGYKREKVRGAFRLDTRIDGNRNTGHSFDGDFDPQTVDWDTVRSGTIGPRLEEPDRWAIVEFLKTL